MEVIKTEIEGCYIINPIVYEDSRGYFYESFNRKAFFENTGIDVNFVQDNQSLSKKGVLRGLHAQKGAHAQSKLVRVLSGEVLDVAVDVRVGSPTFGKSISILLSAANKRQMFIPKGFLHGFLVLSDTAEFFYKCDQYYDKDSEYGVAYNDSTLDIDWGVDLNGVTVSEKDLTLPSFNEVFHFVD